MSPQFDPYSGFKRFERLTRYVYWVQFQTQLELCATFLRLQESYEGPAWRHKKFTLEQYIKWQTKEEGCFTYYDDWRGFNVPCECIKPFINGKFDPLDDREKLLFLLLKRIETKNWYLVATCAEDTQHKYTLEHELAHALWYTSSTYQKEQKKILRTINTKPIYKALIDIGYSKDKDVLEDEAVAYLMDSVEDIKEYGIPMDKYMKARKKLLNNFKKYRKNS